jgi:uncharacterized protein YaaQ
MKLIIAIIRDDDNEDVLAALINLGYRVTKIASTGGFLRRGMTTLMIGLEDNKVDDAIQIISDACAPSLEPGIRRATLFVLKVDQFTQI